MSGFQPHGNAILGQRMADNAKNPVGTNRNKRSLRIEQIASDVISHESEKQMKTSKTYEKTRWEANRR